MTEETQVAEDQQELTIEVDGVQYPYSSLSQQAQELIQMHQRWNGELSKETDRVNQLRAAIQQVSTQVVDVVRADVAKAAEGGETEAPAAQ